ncbi:MAG: LysM peptidoglycan-binding domain-containing protein [Anaerolineae bacterium]|nr:LysM peptidoglycan-binding domain-containing protein [Anaerolineae bacterium]
MTRSNHKWVCFVLCVLLLLGACAPVTVEIAPTATLPSAVPHLTVATFTPVAAGEGKAEPALAAFPGEVEVTEVSAPSDAPGEVLPFAYHTVEPGDTLLGLALEYNIPIAVIQLQNDLGNSIILWAGQVLEIPPAVGWEGASPFWSVYEVQSGDVLSTIAANYGFDVAMLQSVNGLADADLLSVGQALILPLTVPADVALASNHAPATEVPLPTVTPVPQVVAAVAPVIQADAMVTPTAVPATATVAAPVLPVDVAGFPAEIFRLINEQRAAYGLAPLAWNGTLARAAQLHADDCYARGWCGHTGSDGSTMKERIIRQGYDPVRWSECWAWYGTPEMAVAMWMDETPPNDPHRRTILSTWLTEVGVGVVPAADGRGYYFIADFGTPR